MQSIKTLKLHNNPWDCDCKLKNFRDYVIGKGLFDKATTCVEPARLHNKKWDAVSTRDFACKPHIEIPFEYVFGSPGVNATLSCHITGSPRPQARWVVNGRIVNNNTSPVAFSDQKWLLYEEEFMNGIQRWYNLTITNAGYDNLGDYLCVAENQGGVMERKVTLTFDDPSSLNSMGGFGLSNEQWTLVIGAIAASLVFIAMIIAVICCVCFCRSKKKKANGGGKKGKSKNNSGSMMENQHHLSAYGDTMVSDQSHQRLLAATPTSADQHHNIHHQHIMFTNGGTASRHHHSPMEKSTRFGGSVTESLLPPPHQQMTEMTELSNLRAPSVVSSHKQSTTDSSGHSRASFHSAGDLADTSSHYIPDLIHHHHGHKKSSTPLSASGLLSRNSPHQPLLNGSHRVSPSPSSAGASPFTRSGTLPLHYNPRSVSCDHSNASQTLKFHHHHHHGHQKQQQQPHPQIVSQQYASHQRPGYVTLPRRPRASWSAPPRESPSPSVGSSQGLYAMTMKRTREPIYDGVGPRTSADGSSSRISLGTLPKKHSLPVAHHVSVSSHSPHGKQSLPPYYAPIEELAECPPTPLSEKKKDDNKPHSTPNILEASSGNHNNSSVVTSSSEMTLMEENISSYCEPFGKAEMPGEQQHQNSNVNSEKRLSMNSSASELEALIAPPPPKNVSVNMNGSDLSTLSPDQQRPVTSSSGGSSSNHSNASSSKENNNVNGHNGHSNGNNGLLNVEDAIPPMMPLLSPLIPTNLDAPATSDSLGSKKKVPPKTLPKPKVRPVPPPKPKKSALANSSNKPTVFQDEGVDGSEV